MKKIALFLFCIGLISLTGCSRFYDRFVQLNEKSFTSTDANNVELFFTDNIAKPYDPIGYVNIVLCIECGILVPQNQTNALKTMKAIASKHGADAVVNINIQNAKGYNLIGLAVKWK
jgi:hypothetical protein